MTKVNIDYFLWVSMRYAKYLILFKVETFKPEHVLITKEGTFYSFLLELNHWG